MPAYMLHGGLSNWLDLGHWLCFAALRNIASHQHCWAADGGHREAQRVTSGAIIRLHEQCWSVSQTFRGRMHALLLSQSHYSLGSTEFTSCCKVNRHR
jgi:hypothetical protein